MASIAATRRLTKEYRRIQSDPPEFAIAKPSEQNILEWHYVITGPHDTPYHDGQYYGTLTFPPDYPFKPPTIKMVTPSGRFQCNTRLCLSISDFHPKSWNPSWQVSTILTGLVSFMTSEEMTTGGVCTTASARRGYAFDSRGYNVSHATFAREFPELVEENKRVISEQQRQQQATAGKDNKDKTHLRHVAGVTQTGSVQHSSYRLWLIVGAGIGLLMILGRIFQ